MNTDHEKLSAAMRRLASAPTGTPPLDELVRSGRRTVRNRAIGRSVLAGVGVLALVGAALGLTAGAGDRGTAVVAESPTTHATTSPAPHRATPTGPPMRLVAAFDKTAEASFRVAQWSDWQVKDNYCDGSWDPKTRTGWMGIHEGDRYSGPMNAVFGDDFYTRAPAGTADPHGWQRMSPAEVKAAGGRDAFLCGADTATMSGILDDMKKEGPVRYVGRRDKDGIAYDVYQVTSTRPVVGDGSYDTTQTWVRVSSGYVEQIWSWQAPTDPIHHASPTVTLLSHFGHPITISHP